MWDGFSCTLGNSCKTTMTTTKRRPQTSQKQGGTIVSQKVLDFILLYFIKVGSRTHRVSNVHDGCVEVQQKASLSLARVCCVCAGTAAWRRHVGRSPSADLFRDQLPLIMSETSGSGWAAAEQKPDALNLFSSNTNNSPVKVNTLFWLICYWHVCLFFFFLLFRRSIAHISKSLIVAVKRPQIGADELHLWRLTSHRSTAEDDGQVNLGGKKERWWFIMQSSHDINT